MTRPRLRVALLGALLAAAAPAAPSVPEACEASSALASDADADAAKALGLAQLNHRALFSARANRQAGPLAEPRELPPLVFVKTHKTGSSTAANIMHRLAEKRNLSIIFPNHGQVINWPDYRKAVTPRHQFDMICNHQIFNETIVRAYLKPHPFIFSIVREPVANADSNFRAAVTRGERLTTIWGRTWGSRIVAMQGNRNDWQNPSARDFGWYDGVDIRFDPPATQHPFSKDHDRKAIDDFVQKIDKSLDLVFLTEHYNEGLLMLRRRLNLTLHDISYLRMKDDRGNFKIGDPTPEQLDQVKEMLEVDIALYDHFKKRFWQEWEAAGGNSTFGEDLAKLKALNKELEAQCAGRYSGVGHLGNCPLEMTMDNPEFTNRLKLKRMNPTGSRAWS